MKKGKISNIKRLASALLMLVFLSTALAACGFQNENTGAGGTTAQATPTLAAGDTDTAEKADTAEKNGKITDKELEINVLIGEHVSYPVTRYEDSLFLKKITEETGIKLNLMAVPDAGDAYKQKLNIMLNSNEIPDMIWTSKDDALINSLAVKGVFLAYNDYLEYAPNLKSLFESLPDIERSYTAQDGKVYIMPRITPNVMSEIFMIREDILAKEGLSEPGSFDDFYTLLKTLKEKYPDMIPFINRNGGEHLVNRLAYSWGSGYETGTYGFYLNMDTDKYQYGPLDSGFKLMVEWLKKLYDEKILDSEYALRTTKQWEEEMSKGNAVFAIDYIDRVKTINAGYINNNMEARVAAMTIPKGPTGKSGIVAKSAVMANSGIVISAKISDPVAAVKFVNWIYGDKGRLMSSYGIEGETYVLNTDGTPSLAPQMKRQANPDGRELVRDFGWIYYLDKYEFPAGSLKDVTGDPVPQDDRWMYSRKKMEAAAQVIPADPVLKYTEEQTKDLRSKCTNFQDYFKQNIDKFIMGTRPIKEWDQFVEEIKKLGVSDVEKIYNDAYAQYINK